MSTTMSKRKVKKELLGGLDSTGSKPVRAPKHRINPYAACVVQLRRSGKLFLYLNADLPRETHYYDTQCSVCHHGYAELAHAAASSQCSECYGDYIAMRGIELEKQGIRLGWGAHVQDDINPTYIYEQHWRGNVPLSRIDRAYGARNIKTSSTGTIQ